MSSPTPPAQTQAQTQAPGPAPVNKRWTYEESGGLVHPVQPGQIWEVGRHGHPHGYHVYACLDFMSSLGHQMVRDLVVRHPPTLLYCDPPWGQGLINQFRTKAGLEPAGYSWVELYRRIIGYVPLDFPIWLESGRRERARVESEVLKGYRNYAVFDVTYYKRNPSLVYYVGPTACPVDVTGQDDGETPGSVMAVYPRGRVFDPCAGRGGTAVHAARLGWDSLSIELSPYRQSAGLVALTEVVGLPPVRIR